jgi:hypothetical protein
MQASSVEIANQVLTKAQENCFYGQDPFDGLNSHFFKPAPKLRKGLFGLAWIQFHKRSIFNLRPLLAVPAGRNPKGIGLFILGLLEDYKRTQDEKKLLSWVIGYSRNRVTCQMKVRLSGSMLAGDLDSLADALSKLLNNPELRKDYAGAAF